MTSFWDMNPSEPSNGTPTAAECSESAPQRDGSPTCGCTKETSGCSIHPNTRDEWIASMQASLVLILAALEIKPGSETERAADFTEKCSELLASFDPVSCSWKTSQQSLLTNSLEPFSETWPRAGMMRDGRVYQHRQPVPATTVIDGGALQSVPTPTVNGNYNRKGASKTSGDGLITALRKRLPTLTASASKGASRGAMTRKDGRSRETAGLHYAIFALDPSGQLNPEWAEWYMGFPIGHTALKPSATPKSRSKPRLRGKS